MNDIPRAAGAAATALLLALLSGCATADPLAQSGAEQSAQPTPAPDPGPDPAPDPEPGPEPEPEPDPLPVETNEVRLTWVETGGGSRPRVEFPDGMPYFAHFDVNADGGDPVSIESIAIGPEQEFSIDNDGCSGAVVSTDEGCAITLAFTADGVGVFQTVLSVKPAGGPAADMTVAIEVVDESPDPDPDPDGTDGTNGTDGTDGTDDTDGEEGAPLD